MNDENIFQKQSSTTLKRLWPDLEERFSGQVNNGEWEAYRERVTLHFGRLFRLLHRLYGGHYDFFYYIQDLLRMGTKMWIARPDELKALDASRVMDKNWFQSKRMIGAMLYVDRFAGNLAGLREDIPYLSELAITYLHLMPLFKSPEGDNDGGYAISSYREVAPRYSCRLSH